MKLILILLMTMVDSQYHTSTPTLTSISDHPVLDKDSVVVEKLVGTTTRRSKSTASSSKHDEVYELYVSLSWRNHRRVIAAVGFLVRRERRLIPVPVRRQSWYQVRMRFYQIHPVPVIAAPSYALSSPPSHHKAAVYHER
jgi:hypothetical protein